MAVFESALAPRLKATAAVLALFSLTDDGKSTDRIWPSVHRVGHLLGKSGRAVRSDISELVALGVLVPLTPRTGGRSRTTRYKLQHLPTREPWTPKPGPGAPPLPPRNPEAGFTVSTEKPGSPAPETRKPSAQNPEAQNRKPGSPLPPRNKRSTKRGTREREHAAAPSLAPGPPIFHNKLSPPTPTNGSFPIRSGAYVTGVVNVPVFLHRSLVDRLLNAGAPTLDDAEHQAFAFYRKVCDRYRGQSIGDSERAFWQARIEEKLGTTTTPGGGRPTVGANNAAVLKRWREGHAS